MRSSFLTLLALALVAPPAEAWHDTGHRLTAEIAFGVLNEFERSRVTAVLRAHPRFEPDFRAHMPDEIANADEQAKARWIFEHASIWPDLVDDIDEQVRNDYHRGSWHYINLPLFLTENDEKELAGKLDHNVSMEFTPPLREGLNVVQALQGNLLVWRDAKASDAEKAVALCWILHLTGDMHQPLHNVALFSMRYFPEGDRGGNSIGIEQGEEDTNLHAVWDGLINADASLRISEDTLDLLSHDVADIGSIASWSRRHYELAKAFVYTAEVKDRILAQQPSEEHPLINLSADYIDTARPVAEQQIIIAGHRIAALISGWQTESR